jgi:two-component system, chemotaxis family, sensor kinase CheA
VLTRNQIVAYSLGVEDAAVGRAAQRLNLIASELQEGVMKTRMQPIDNVWSKLPRVVRDLGLSCGKQVRLEMEGRDTELDKTLLEAVKDPLMHCVRNSVDHGIEHPQVRVAAGKPAEGTLLLRAFHEGGQVNIEIIDDGGGIDPRRVGGKAVERGLVSAEQLSRMSEREILHMIFLPGFSTAATVTNVSGRGVGMDVVKTNIEKIGGTVDVTSVVGRGTTFRIKIPLTLAIIPALTVTCAGDRYAIPQVSLVELVRLDAGSRGAGKGIEHISGAPVLRLRGNLLPLMHLDEQLGLPGRVDGSGATFIVVLQSDDRQFGLVVHEVLDTEEIVVKPLGSQLKGIGVYAGATILGDGAVALILDCLALAQQAHVVPAAGDRDIDDRGAAAGTAAEPSEPLLIVDCGGSRRAAIPLAMVTRLEEFALDAVERVGSREVVQYRGRILPLVRMAQFLGAHGDDAAQRLQVVVYSAAGRSVGLVVEAILDITEEVLTARSDLDDHGVLGSAVVQDRITEMLDVRQAILAADRHFYAARDVAQAGVLL